MAITIISSLSLADDLTKYFQAGVDPIIEKPFSPRRLSSIKELNNRKNEISMSMSKLNTD